MLSVERPFERRTPCIGLGVGGGGPRGRCTLPHPDKLLLLPTFVLSNAAEVVLRAGASPGGMTSVAPGATTTSTQQIQLLICHVYVTNHALHDDLKVPFIKDVIQEKSINHHDKLGNHSNPILQPLLEQQQRGRLKKLWSADLIDG
jgi:hypothetical protein